MKTYTVRAVRCQNWWGLTVPELPGVVSQVRSLTQAEEYAREAIAWIAQVPPNSFAVEVVPELPDDLAEKVEAARVASLEAETAAAKSSALSRTVVNELTKAGLSGRETAVILGLSKQRVSQLARSSRHPEPSVEPDTRA